MVMRFLDHLEEWITATFMGAATVIIFIAVVHRYAAGWAAHTPYVYDIITSVHLTWAQELCIYLFIWMAKFGAAYGVRTGIHVGVDVLINSFKPPLYRKFVVLGLLSGATFTFIVAWLGTRFVWEIYQTGQVSPDLEWPMWVIYLAIPLGTSLMCFRFLQVCWQFIQTGYLPHGHRHIHVEGLGDVEIKPGAVAASESEKAGGKK